MYYHGATRTMQSLRATTPPLYYKRPDVITNTISSNNNNRYNSNTNNNNAPNVTNTSVNGGSMTTANMKERYVLGVMPDNESFTHHDIKNKNVAKQNSLSRNNAVAQHFSNTHATMQNVNNTNYNIDDDVTNEYNGNVGKEEAVTTNNNNYYNYNLENKRASLMSLYRNSTMDSNAEMYSNASHALLSTAPSAVPQKGLASYNGNNNNNTKLFIQPFTSANLPSTSHERYNTYNNNNNNNNNNIRPSISESNYTNNISKATAISKNDNNNDDDNNRFSSDANVNYNTSSRADSGFANMRQGDLPYYNNYNSKQQQEQQQQLQLPLYNKRNVYDMNADRLTELEKESYALGMEEMHFKALLLQETQTQRQQEELQLNLSRGWAQLLEAEERYYSEPLPDRSEEIHTRECVCNDLEHYLHQLNDQLTELLAERDNLHIVLTQKEALETELTQMVTHLHNLANRQQMSRLEAEAWFELEQQRVKCGKRFVRELDRQLSAMIDTDAWNAADLTSLTQEEEIKARVPHILAQLIANNDIRVKKVEAVCLQSTNMNGNNNNSIYKSNNIKWSNKTDKIANATSNNNNYNSSSYVHFAPNNSYVNNLLSENNNFTTALNSSGGLTSSPLTETASLSDNTDLRNVHFDTLTTTNLCGGSSFCIGLNDASSDDDDDNNKDDSDVKHSFGNRNANALGGKSVIFSLNNTSRSSNIHYNKSKNSLQHKRAKVEVVNA